MSSQMLRSNVPVQQMAPQPILPSDQDTLIRTLNDVNQRDDVKLKAVQVRARTQMWIKFIRIAAFRMHGASSTRSVSLLHLISS